MPFTWQRKGDVKWTDAEVELLLQEKEKQMVAEEVGPKKDELKAVKKAMDDAAAAAKAEIEAKLAELKTAQDQVTALESEVNPFRAQTRLGAIKKALIEKRKEGEKEINPLINPEKFDDILLLAKVADTDNAEDAIKKVSEFVAARTEFAFVEPKAEPVVPVVTPASPAIRVITQEPAKPAAQPQTAPRRMVVRGDE